MVNDTDVKVGDQSKHKTDVDVDVNVIPTDLDPVQVEAAAYFSRDAYSKPLDRDEVLKNVKARREEREKWERDQAKK